MSRGLYIAKNHGDINKKETLYSSDRPHLQINLLPTPPHMDVVVIKGGTGWVGLSGTHFYGKETLLTIPYDLEYIPELLIYFDAYKYDNSTSDPKAGFYGADRLIYSGASGVLYDVIYAEVAEKEIRIVHEFDNDGGCFYLAYTSDADRYDVRIKYYIISKDSHTTDGYDTRGF